MENLHNYLPKDLVNIIEEYHIISCTYCIRYGDEWKSLTIDEEGNYYCGGGCRKWFRYFRTKARNKEKIKMKMKIKMF